MASRARTAKCAVAYLVAFKDCLNMLCAVPYLEALLVLVTVPLLCRPGRLAATEGRAIMGALGGTTQYSRGSPSKYGIPRLPSSALCSHRCDHDDSQVYAVIA